ncbi:MAG TPA: MFS transporter, partial [Chloroflexota bacterium]|nr:MFS transporter [Chloroflexota bacterium]
MRRSSLPIVYLAVFVDLLGFGIILPILPFYAEKYGANGLWVGAILTAYSAAQLVSALFLGRLSDRIGRRPVLLASLLGSALSLTATGFANSLVLLLISRLIAGAFGGSITTAQAYVADVTTPSERTKYMGLLGASIGMGFVFGPGIGAALSGFGFSTAAFVAAGVAALNFLIGIVKLPESRVPGQANATRRNFHLTDVIAALGQPTLGSALLSTFIATVAFVAMEATFALFGQVRYGLNPEGLGMIFTFVGIVVAVVQGGLIGRLHLRYDDRTLAGAGAVCMGVAFFLIPLMPTLLSAVVVLGFLAAGQGLISPTLSSMVSQSSGIGEQGQTLGIGQSLSAGARAVGPLFAGWLYDRSIALPYLLAAALMLLV